ncbi:hypothetical protein [Salmonella phage SSBI34]|nr:hypothetical protein [Salmonella phage SSBI34]
MNNFHGFVTAMQKQLTKMAKTGLFEVSLDKDFVWNTYLDSFPEGTNLIYKERREYDCNCCKQFIRDLGRVVTFVDGEMVTIWDISVPSYYQVVVGEMSKLIKSAKVTDEFLHFQAKVGTERSVILGAGEEKTIVFNHFHAVLPSQYVERGDKIATKLNDSRGNKQVLERSLKELTIDSAETALELIAQNSLYRGNEAKPTLEKFVELKRQFSDITDDVAKEAFLWTKSKELGAFGKFRNTAVGTLLQDLSEGMDLETAVKRWENVMAPANYKRPTALVTEAMIKKAQTKVEELGMMDSLPRRYAVAEDLTINNVLFAGRSIKKSMNAFDDLMATAKKPKAGPSNVEEISIADFVANVLPKAESIEVLVENRHVPNLMTLVAPVYADAPNMLKWDNNFSWSYNGEVTDSIKERVKAAGGSVTGELRVSLSWFNPDDLDLYLTEPNGNRVYFGNRFGSTGAELDVDMNAYGKSDAFNPVENITWSNMNRMVEGIYSVEVNNFNKRLRDREGFVVELDFRGNSTQFVYDKAVTEKRSVKVLTFEYSRIHGIKILDSIGSTKQSKEVWGIATEQFQKVSMVMNSPNHWDGQGVGNKHMFFILEGCANPEGTRGFYNEYLRNDLAKEHGKVFEHLAAKMKVAKSDRQLAGIGFSDTVRNEVTVKVSGSFTRTLKVKF